MYGLTPAASICPKEIHWRQVVRDEPASSRHHVVNSPKEIGWRWPSSQKRAGKYSSPCRQFDTFTYSLN